MALGAWQHLRAIVALFPPRGHRSVYGSGTFGNRAARIRLQSRFLIDRSDPATLHHTARCERIAFLHNLTLSAVRLFAYR
jgi:hypothetical protein